MPSSLSMPSTLSSLSSLSDPNPLIDQAPLDLDLQMFPMDMVSDTEIMDAFKQVTDAAPSTLDEFSFEGILNLGPLPHDSHEVIYRSPSPSSLNALPTFTTTNLTLEEPTEHTPTAQPKTYPKPRFSTVKACPSPPRSAAASLALTLKALPLEPRDWSAGSVRSVFSRLNEVLARPPPKPPYIRKPVVKPRNIKQVKPVETTVLSSFRQQKISKPVPKSVGKSVAKSVAKHAPMPPVMAALVCREVVFNNTLVCAA